MKQGKGYQSLPREHPLPTTQEKTLHMDIIRLIIFFAAKDGEALYSQQKQDLELTVAQSMSSLLQNSGLIEEIRENYGASQMAQ